MAVTFGASGSVDGGGVAVSALTGAAFSMAANSVCWAILAFDSSTTPASLAVNWNTSEALSVITGCSLNDATNITTLIAFGLKNPTSGSHTFHASWTGAVTASMGFASATGADATTPFQNGTKSTTGHSGTTATITITSATNNLTVAGFSGGQAFSAVSDHQEWRSNVGGQLNYAACDKAGSASNTQTGTLPADVWDAVGFDILAASGGPTVQLGTTRLLMGVGT